MTRPARDPMRRALELAALGRGRTAPNPPATRSRPPGGPAPGAGLRSVRAPGLFTSVGESTVGIAIFDDDGPEPEARIAFRPGQRRVSVTRRGTVEVGGPDESNVMIIPPDEPSVLDLRVIVDGSVMEVFADGRTAATFRLPSVHRGRRRVAPSPRVPRIGWSAWRSDPSTSLAERAAGRILPDGLGFLLRLTERTCVPLRPRSPSCDRGSLAVVVRGDDHQLLSRSTRDREM